MGVPSWVNKAGVVTIGDVSPACAKDISSQFGLTIAGVPEASLTPANIQDALGKVLQSAVAKDKQAWVPDCTKTSYAMPVGSDTPFQKTKKLSSAAICLFSDIKTTSDRRGGVKITGTSNSGAGMNPGGVNTILKAAIAKGLTVDGKAGTTSGITGDGCSDADKKAAGSYAGSACGNAPSPAPGLPPGPGPSPGPSGGGGGSSKLAWWKILLIAVGSVAFVGIVALGVL